MIKRIAAVFVVAALGVAVAPVSEASALVLRGRTGCQVLGTCDGGSWGGTGAHKPGRATPPNFHGVKAGFYR